MYILSVMFSNFYSFSDEVFVNFTTTKAKATHSTDEYCGRYVNKINGVFGANGSGKTTVLKAISFIDYFAYSSFSDIEKDEPIAMEPHALHENEPSRFRLEYFHEDNVFRYELVLKGARLESEALHVLNQSTNKFNSIFRRIKIENGYKTTAPQANLIPKHAELFDRDNCSLSSYIIKTEKVEALEKRHPLLYSAISAYSCLRTNVVSSGKNDNFQETLFDMSQSLIGHERIILKFIESVIRNIDLGVSELEIQKIKVLENQKISERDLIFAKHRDNEGGEYSIPIFNESTGTQKILCALWRLLPVMWSGGVAVYDELDSDLHPYIMPFIIDLFMNPEINIRKGQLIFSGHTLEAIKDLSKSQIFFTEKHNLRSEIFRADELAGLRSDDSIYKKYIMGALGGVPELDASEISLYQIIEDSQKEMEAENAS